MDWRSHGPWKEGFYIQWLDPPIDSGISFKDNPHPDEKERLALGKKLNLENKQIKFWFKNRRTQMKV
ncbi:hypothetical protein L6452_14613 [Arctium lappa]|uniref:Uncharacterized protein n=1 Tax=Arctium lappa TaxID=4217 RepID=A0ACB9CLP0_ARCLA|nr:hypothetical protein L6452_14613 [Arctium lappa]